MRRRRPPAPPLALALLASWSIGCGARTALEVADAGAAPPEDAGFFVTFPCRWYLGRPLPLARGAGFADLTGAVHPGGVLVAVAATEVGRSERVGALVYATVTPELRGELRGPELVGAFFTGLRGFLRQEPERCALVEHDTEWVAGRSFAWRSSDCALGQSEVGYVESWGRGGELERVGPLFAAEPSVEEPRVEVLGPSVAADRVELFVSPDDAILVTVAAARDAIVVERTRRSDGASERLVLGAAGPPEIAFGAAPDRLRGGVLILHHGAATGWALDRVPFEGPLEARSVVDLASLPAPPLAHLVTNETEALLGLSNGQLVYVPLAGPDLRLLEPVADAPLDAFEIVLRPGQSEGALLYAYGAPGGSSVLELRPLVCNR